MKALVIAPQPFFSPRGTPYSVYYRTLITSELGVEVDLLTYGEGEDINIEGVRIRRIPRFRFLEPVKIGPSCQKLYLDIFLLIWTIDLLLRKRYHFVHAHEEAAFFCRFLKPVFGFKLIYDMHSSLPQQLSNYKFTKSKIIVKIFKFLEESCLNAADVVITICPELSSYAKRVVRNSIKLVMIENSIFEPVKLKSRSEKDYSDASSLSKKDQELFSLLSMKKVIVYAGNLEPYQGIDILLGAFRKVIGQFPDAFLLTIGGDKYQVDHYRQLASKYGICGSILFTGRVAQEAVQYFCSKASVFISPRSDGSFTPLKIYNHLASGLPLVATNIYSHTQVLNDQIAILVDPNPDDMARGILKALRSDKHVKQIAENAKKYYQENYSRLMYKIKMGRVLEQLN